MPVEVLSNLPHSSEVLIDANIFVYALLEVSPQCVEFLRRCSDEEVLAVTTADVVSDVCHRLMLAEAESSAWPADQGFTPDSRFPSGLPMNRML